MAMSHITGAFASISAIFYYMVGNRCGIFTPPVNNYLTFPFFFNNNGRHAVCASAAVSVSLRPAGKSGWSRNFLPRGMHRVCCVPRGFSRYACKLIGRK